MTMRRLLRTATAGCLAVALTVGATACSAGPQLQVGSGAMGANAQVGDVLLRSVHVAAPTTASYPSGADARLWFTLLNDGAEPDTLTSVSSPVASRTRLRWDSDCDGTAQAVDALALRPTKPAVGESPGTVPPFDAYHAELIDLNREVLAGTVVPVVFEFARAGRVTVEAIVQPSDAPRPAPTARCAA